MHCPKLFVVAARQIGRLRELSTRVTKIQLAETNERLIRTANVISPIAFLSLLDDLKLEKQARLDETLEILSVATKISFLFKYKSDIEFFHDSFPVIDN